MAGAADDPEYERDGQYQPYSGQHRAVLLATKRLKSIKLITPFFGTSYDKPVEIGRGHIQQTEQARGLLCLLMEANIEV